MGTASLTHEHLSLQTEEEYSELIQKLGTECEEYQPSISINAGA
ncbi:10228_t:CDS:2 [Racocetra fulgida]|uniref:10228_t:CDS:1 n=1 Tax=Racocetra fulgida TaxID=60492 RepID=A0A9N8VYF2_9GLOM|nr:10228_t:CDS:2 [Racocetra fulgida]